MFFIFSPYGPVQVDHNYFSKLSTCTSWSGAKRFDRCSSFKYLSWNQSWEFMPFLDICKFNEDPIQNEHSIWRQGQICTDVFQSRASNSDRRIKIGLGQCQICGSPVIKRQKYSFSFASTHNLTNLPQRYSCLKVWRTWWWLYYKNRLTLSVFGSAELKRVTAWIKHVSNIILKIFISDTK